MGVHLAEPQRQGIEILLQRSSCAVDDGLLLGEFRAPGLDLTLRVADAERPGGEESAVERHCADDEGDGEIASQARPESSRI